MVELATESLNSGRLVWSVAASSTVLPCGDMTMPSITPPAVAMLPSTVTRAPYASVPRATAVAPPRTSKLLPGAVVPKTVASNFLARANGRRSRRAL